MKKEFVKGLVSVITPTFNSSRLIEETIGSVRSQTFKNWELHITDDCSSDNTCFLIEKIQKDDKRINLHRLPVNSGAAAARNCSLERSSGQYAAFLDADDQWLPEKLEHQIKFMKETGAPISFTMYREMSEDGIVGKRVIDADSPSVVSYRAMLKKAATMGCLTVIVDREKAGDFRMPNIKTGQDYATWLAILKKGNIAMKLEESLSLYRISSNSISRNKLKKAKRQWQIYRELERLNTVNATWCFMHYGWRAINRR